MRAESFFYCGLCQSQEVSRCENQSQGDSFFKCTVCHLIFKDPKLHLNPEDEKKRYSSHNNHIEDPGYVKFLWPVVQQVKKNLSPTAQGLDYGCGPNPVLCQLLEKENYQMAFYDPYFFPTDLKKISSLDFVTCTEAAEHFYHPGQEFKKILSFIKPQGFLFLMTDLVQKEMNLSTWFYAKDPSHVCFFSEETLRWMAQYYNLNLELVSTRLACFTT